MSAILRVSLVSYSGANRHIDHYPLGWPRRYRGITHYVKYKVAAPDVASTVMVTVGTV